MKRFRFRMGIGFLFIGLAAITLFSFIVMGLWNSVLVAVLHVSVITFWQALGILALSKILFSGFPGGRNRGHHRHSEFYKNPEWRKEMHDKWWSMTPEEKLKFKDNWKERCRNWKQETQQQYNENKPGERTDAATD